MTIENRLGDAQLAEALSFLDRLSPTDRTNVEHIVATVGELAKSFEDDSTTNRGIFGVYGIGGYVTKEGERPDVDVLIVGSGRWERGYYNHENAYPQGRKKLPKRYWRETSGDHILGSLADHFGNNGFDVEIPEEVPDDYTDGADPKILMRLKPQEGYTVSPIDIVYVKGHYSRPPIRTFEDFYRYDTTPEGQEIGKVALLETVVAQPTFEQRYGGPKPTFPFTQLRAKRG
ncbi:MAG: hypothetical protein AAB896_02170 [Patescibacteria group bacterium]